MPAARLPLKLPLIAPLTISSEPLPLLIVTRPPPSDTIKFDADRCNPVELETKLKSPEIVCPPDGQRIARSADGDRPAPKGNGQATRQGNAGQIRGDGSAG